MAVVAEPEQLKAMTGSGERRFATVNPAIGEVVQEYPFLSSDQVTAVVEKAHEAFLSWRERPIAERAGRAPRRGSHAGARRRARSPHHAGDGQAHRGGARGGPWVAGILHYYGEKGPSFLEPEPLPVEDGEAFIVNTPLGVLLGIQPWNFPLYQVARFAGPNLVAGNTVLLKHSEVCPQTALALEQLFCRRRDTDGVYTNVFLSLPDVQRVIAHPAVQGVSVTGSERAGAAVAEIAGRHLKKCVLELGGSDPFIVLDRGAGADLQHILDEAAGARLGNTGQSCTAAERMIVVEDLYDDFVAGLAKRFMALVLGDPADPATTLGPLSSERAASGLMAQVRDAVDKGATVVTGGGRPDRPSAFLDATVLIGVRPGMRAYSEELFGPVAVVYRVPDQDAAVELANSSPFGLGGAVFWSDPRRARAVADRLDSGMVWINHGTGSEAALPFGGIKRSGYGRELSRLGIQEFVNRKLVRVYPAGAYSDAR